MKCCDKIIVCCIVFMPYVVCILYYLNPHPPGPREVVCATCILNCWDSCAFISLLVKPIDHKQCYAICAEYTCVTKCTDQKT